MDLRNAKAVAIAAAAQAGGHLARKLGQVRHIRKKGAIDLVTEADTESEGIILGLIRDAFPDHTIISEEEGRVEGRADRCWIIDPLDGTTNFAHGLGLFSISIAFNLDGETHLGVVSLPAAGELFVATRGAGATLNGRPIGVSDTPDLSDSLLVTGFPYNFPSIWDAVMQRFGRCLSASQGVRRLGSAAIDLCYVACGRFEAFWEQNLQPWDTAAGALIAAEAGARVTDFGGRPFTPESNEILATNGRIHARMVDLMQL
jgi:myo-inositol-1(or 4)-monophosphatase